MVEKRFEREGSEEVIQVYPCSDCYFGEASEFSAFSIGCFCGFQRGVMRCNFTN